MYIFIFSFVASFGNPSGKDLQLFLEDRLAEKYDLQSSNINLKIYHVPNLDFSNIEFRISGDSQLKLGYNRANIQMLKDGRIENEFQITYSAQIEVLTPVLKHDVKFGQPVKTDDLILKRKVIDNGYEDYFRTTTMEEEMVARALLRKGEIVKKSDLKRKPAIERGQEVGLKVVTGNILIELSGLAKESGGLGEKIRVYNQETRRHYFGIIESPQSVVINVE